jgi:hypothetical protein
MDHSPATRLLTRHFLRRFFDNDLISPHVDLHDNVATLAAVLLTTTLFASVLFATGTLFGIPTPGLTAILGLGNRFFFISASMIVMALVATVQWDAMSLDARDMSNLGPLPIPLHVLIRAKLAALVSFAAGFAVALNLLPSLIYESLLALKMPVGLTGLLRLVVAHAVVTMAASACAFLAVLALREVLRAVLGERWFRRVSTLVQALLVVALVGALLLLPGLKTTMTRSWVAEGFPAPHAVPPFWFLGLLEWLAGDVIAGLTHLRFRGRLDETNQRALATYRSHEALFADLAGVALVALAVVAVVAVAAYAWNIRRLPQPVPASARRGRGLELLTRVFAGSHPVTRAGFAFALRAVLRSAPHRLAMATAAALAFALSFVMVRNVHFRGAVPLASVPLSVLALQTVVWMVLLAGFRNAVRVPAELKANWIFQIAGAGDERRYLAGVKRAAIVAIPGTVLLALWPVHAWLFGSRAALAHLGVGLLASIVFAEALFSGFRKIPFASTYLPGGNLKTLGPIMVLLFLFVVSAFAWLERVALQTDRGTLMLLGCLAIAFAGCRVLDLWRRRGRAAIEFDEAPEPATQWLGLSG